MMGGMVGNMGEVGIPVRVHGTLYVQPHADEAFIDTVAEVVEEMVPEVVRETVDDLSDMGVPVSMRDVEVVS
jgi:lactam utilization protein B